MNDRELLELAAKAAGLKHVDYTGVDYDGRLGIVLVDDIGRHCGEFSPLTDDGEALRLAVSLGIHMAFYGDHIAVQQTKTKMITAQARDGDMFGATRRAIVRAAAEIGKAMQ